MARVGKKSFRGEHSHSAKHRNAAEKAKTTRDGSGERRETDSPAVQHDSLRDAIDGNLPGLSRDSALRRLKSAYSGGKGAKRSIAKRLDNLREELAREHPSVFEDESRDAVAVTEMRREQIKHQIGTSRRRIESSGAGGEIIALAEIEEREAANILIDGEKMAAQELLIGEDVLAEAIEKYFGADAHKAGISYEFITNARESRRGSKARGAPEEDELDFETKSCTTLQELIRARARMNPRVLRYISQILSKHAFGGQIAVAIRDRDIAERIAHPQTPHEIFVHDLVELIKTDPEQAARVGIPDVDQHDEDPLLAHLESDNGAIETATAEAPENPPEDIVSEPAEATQDVSEREPAVMEKPAGGSAEFATSGVMAATPIEANAESPAVDTMGEPASQEVPSEARPEPIAPETATAEKSPEIVSAIRSARTFKDFIYIVSGNDILSAPEIERICSLNERIRKGREIDENELASLISGPYSGELRNALERVLTNTEFAYTALTAYPDLLSSVMGARNVFENEILYTTIATARRIHSIIEAVAPDVPEKHGILFAHRHDAPISFQSDLPANRLVVTFDFETADPNEVRDAIIAEFKRRSPDAVANTMEPIDENIPPAVEPLPAATTENPPSIDEFRKEEVGPVDSAADVEIPTAIPFAGSDAPTESDLLISPAIEALTDTREQEPGNSGDVPSNPFAEKPPIHGEEIPLTKTPARKVITRKPVKIRQINTSSLAEVRKLHRETINQKTKKPWWMLGF